MKQTVVLSVSLSHKKTWPCFIFGKLTSPSEALKIVAGFPGVESIAWKAEDKSKLEVTGEDIDPVCLTKKLRKKIGHIKILSVQEKKEEKKEEKKKEVKKEEKDEAQVPYMVCTAHPGQLFEFSDYNRDFCTIL